MKAGRRLRCRFLPMGGIQRKSKENHRSMHAEKDKVIKKLDDEIKKKSNIAKEADGLRVLEEILRAVRMLTLFESI